MSLNKGSPLEPTPVLDPKQLEELEKKLQETKSKLEQFVRDYPLSSVAMALGLGYVLGRLFHRVRL